MTISLIIAAALLISNTPVTYADTLVQAERCYGGKDEDGDGLIDCEDPHCAKHPICVEKPMEKICDDESDNDGDGFTDCDDGDCSKSIYCMLLEEKEGINCGDGACYPDQGESCAIMDVDGDVFGRNTCASDCGYCPSKCGNDYCETGETSKNCPNDCGTLEDFEEWDPYCGDEACSSDETEQSCALDCIPQAFCGDGACSNMETSVNCPSECMVDTESLAKRFPGIRDIESLPESIVFDDIDEENREALSQSIENLQASIAEVDQEFVDRLGDQGVVLTASLLEKGESLTRAAVAMAEELKKEALEIRSTISNILTDAAVFRRLNLLQNKKELIAAADEQDLYSVRRFLPPSMRSTSENIERLNMLEENFDSSDEPVAEKKISIILNAWAEKIESGEKEKSAKSAFKYSAFLLARMEALGIDPETGERRIEDDIKELKERKDMLAGITGLVSEEEVEQSLNEAEESLKQPTTDSVLSIRGIFRHLASSKNFQELENIYSSAIGRMRTGFDRMRALVSWQQITPQAEAKTLLQADLARKLESTDAEDQKEAMLMLLDEQRKELSELLEKLSEEEKKSYEDKLDQLEVKLGAAESTDDVRKVAMEFSVITMEIEEALRSEKNIFQKMIYRMHDFLGRSS